MSHARKLPVLLIVAAIAAACASLANAQVSEIGHIVTRQGEVSVERSGDLWALSVGQTVATGQVLVTGPTGYARVELSDHSIIEVFPSSRLVFRPNPGNWRDLLDIYLGKVRLEIQHLTDGGPPYHVTSPTAVISIRGTVLDVQVDPSQTTTVQVETGVVSVRHRLFPGKAVTVKSGQTLEIIANVPLAAAKGTSPFVIAARIARIAGETLARVTGPATRSGGHGSAPKSSSASGGGSSAGTNQPAPPPGQGGSGGGNGSGNNGGHNSPPGDVIK